MNTLVSNILKSFPILGLFLAGMIAPIQAESVRSLNKKGIEAYQIQQYDKAAQHFDEAKQKLEDENLLVEYNRGVARAADQNYDEALKDLNKVSAAREKDIASRALYSKGVVTYKQAKALQQEGDLEKALVKATEAFRANRAALKNNPADNEARINLELAAALREELQKEQQKQQQKNQDQNKDQQEDKDKNKQDQKDNQEDQQKQDQKKQDQQKQQEQKEKEEQEKQKQDQEKQDQDKKDQEEQQQNQKQEQQDKENENQDKSDSQDQQPQDQEQEQQEKQDMEREAVLSILNLLEDNDVEALKRMMRQRSKGYRDREKAW
ncbi:MAG: hypothetical protein ACLFQ6_00145 [Candidatus Sumerlaeia bacterium]